MVTVGMSSSPLCGLVCVMTALAVFGVPFGLFGFGRFFRGPRWRRHHRHHHHHHRRF